AANAAALKTTWRFIHEESVCVPRSLADRARRGGAIDGGCAADRGVQWAFCFLAPGAMLRTGRHSPTPERIGYAWTRWLAGAVHQAGHLSNYEHFASGART